MQAYAVFMLISCLPVIVGGAELACIPDRCDVTQFNTPTVKETRSVDKEDVETSAKPSSKNAAIKNTLSAFVRRRHDLAQVFRTSQRKGGINNQWMVTLFNYDKDGKFAKKYSSIIKDNTELGDKDASVFTVETGDEDILKELCRSPEVAYLEQMKTAKIGQNDEKCKSQIMFDFETIKWVGSWGLTRIDQVKGPFDNFYVHDIVNTTKEYDVFTYVADTGIEGSRTDQFGDRIVDGVDLTSTDGPFKDINGHGTHVAGSLASERYGVAKNVKLVSVRITTGADDTFPLSVVLQALSWIRNHVKQHKKQNKAVVNLSFGSPGSVTVNMQVNSMVEEGIAVVAAAGNEEEDACCSSPASASGAITVACSNPIDEWCSFSNWGPCVDLMAPGWETLSVHHNGFRFDPSELSGTSMSAPHVSGAAAVLMARAGGMSPTAVKATLLNTASKGRITKIKHPQITPNALVFSRCIEQV